MPFNKLSQNNLLAQSARGGQASALEPRFKSSTTIAGHFPLVPVTGAGAEARNSIGWVLAGGMTIGSLFTLFVIPSINMLTARDHSKVKNPQSAPVIA